MVILTKHLLKLPFAIIAAMIFYASHANAQEYLQDMPDSSPKKIFSDKAGRFYLDYGTSIFVYDKGKTWTVRLTGKFGRMTVNSRHTTVTNKGRIITFVTASYSETITVYVNGKTQTTTVVVEKGSFVEMCAPRCAYHAVNGTLAESKFIKDANGRVFYKINRGKAGFGYYINGEKVNRAKFEQESRNSLPAEIYSKKNGTLAGVLDNEIAIDYLVGGTRQVKVSRYRGSYSIVWDTDNNPHVFFHDPEQRNFRHHYVNRSDNNIYEAEVDFSESGFENIAFAEGDVIWTIHYFYRDPFNKGLLVSKLDNSGRILNQFVLDASQKRNVGWELRGERAPDGRILLTYLTDTESDTRVYLLLKDTSELVSMGNNLASYGHVGGPGKLGGLSAVEQQELGRELADSFRKELKSYALSVGVGAQYAFWHMDAENELDYDIENALVNLVEFQGKLFNVDYGVEYAEEVIETNAVQTDGGKNVARYFGAYVGWDRLLYNYDFKLSLEQSKTKVKLTDKTDNTIINYDMDYVGIKLSLLTQQRTQFGLVYQRFNQYRKIGKYTFNTGPGWQFNSEGLGELDADIYALHYGYTTINYLEKYGVRENRAYLDLEARGGLVSYTFKGPSTAPWGEAPDPNSSIMLGGQIEVGWIWFRRWKSLWNMGGYVKLGYRVNFDYFPDEKPGEDTEGTDGELRYVLDNASILRHGPLAMIAFTF